jgi:hypothetical protein
MDGPGFGRVDPQQQVPRHVVGTSNTCSLSELYVDFSHPDNRTLSFEAGCPDVLQRKCSSMVNTGFFWDCPKHPVLRLSQSWPATYDSVRCYSCKIILNDWQDLDFPLVEHLKFQVNCDSIRSLLKLAGRCQIYRVKDANCNQSKHDTVLEVNQVFSWPKKQGKKGEEKNSTLRGSVWRIHEDQCTGSIRETDLFQYRRDFQECSCSGWVRKDTVEVLALKMFRRVAPNQYRDLWLACGLPLMTDASHEATHINMGCQWGCPNEPEKILNFGILSIALSIAETVHNVGLEYEAKTYEPPKLIRAPYQQIIMRGRPEIVRIIERPPELLIGSASQLQDRPSSLIGQTQSELGDTAAIGAGVPPPTIAEVATPDQPYPEISPSYTCPICLELLSLHGDKLIHLAPCGHMTCLGCGNLMQDCPVCKRMINFRSRLFFV